MTRGSRGKIRFGRTEGRHKFEVRKGRVLVFGKVYQVTQVIDHTERESRLVIEAPPTIEAIIISGLYKYMK